MKLNLANLIGVVACILLFLFIGVILYPIGFTERVPAKDANCQSNMTQLGRAFKMYLSDWDYTYPTNRAWSQIKGKPGAVAETVKLTPAGLMNAKGSPVKFLYGVNWVECLYSYVEAAGSSNDAPTVWRCPKASSATYPSNSKTACTSYVYNRNLVEMQEDKIVCSSNLMIAREADRLVNADLRPLNNSAGSPKKMPSSAFLNSRDIRMGKTNELVHDKGSHILFADGHVKFFDASYFSPKPEWDPVTRQWYNFVISQNPALDQSIAITP